MKKVVVLAGLLLPSAAWACPSCAAKPTDNLPVWLLLGGMIVVPYGVAFFAIRAIRRALRREAAGEVARP